MADNRVLLRYVDFVATRAGLQLSFGEVILGVIQQAGAQWRLGDLLFNSPDEAALHLLSLQSLPPELVLRVTRGASPTVPPEVERALVDFTTPDAVPPSELACHYGENRIVALPLDPRSAFIYWELTAAAVGRARAALASNDAALCLRIFLLGDAPGEQEVRDFAVDEWIGRFDVTLDKPVARLLAAIGFRSGEAFAHIARSQAVPMPRDSAGNEPVRFRYVIAFDDAGHRLPDGTVDLLPDGAVDLLPDGFHLVPGQKTEFAPDVPGRIISAENQAEICRCSLSFYGASEHSFATAESKTKSGNSAAGNEISPQSSYSLGQTSSQFGPMSSYLFGKKDR